MVRAPSAEGSVLLSLLATCSICDVARGWRVANSRDFASSAPAFSSRGRILPLTGLPPDPPPTPPASTHDTPLVRPANHSSTVLGDTARMNISSSIEFPATKATSHRQDLIKRFFV